MRTQRWEEERIGSTPLSRADVAATCSYLSFCLKGMGPMQLKNRPKREHMQLNRPKREHMQQLM
jgi:hypothetical protein